jgi:short-chain Z-isoprenyl diphosphate synthase
LLSAGRRDTARLADLTTLCWPDWARRAWASVLGQASRPLYTLYEQRLLGQVVSRPPPRHVGLVLDGNRRHALQAGLADPHAIYALGARKLDDVLDWCAELAIPVVTLWVCSTDNLARSSEQVAGILQAVEDKLRALAEDPQIHSRRVRVRAIGRLSQLPASTQEAIRVAEAATAGYDTLLLSIAVAYGGREEIADAVRAVLAEAQREGATLAEAAEAVTPEAIERHLYLPDAPEPDLLIRTSGELRLSGFLLWQSARSEFYFSDVLWPRFRKIDFLRAVRSFQDRTRRFGR